MLVNELHFVFTLFVFLDARYRARLLAVGQASMEDKKFDLARKAFELANDTFALLNLYVVSNHKVYISLMPSKRLMIN